MAKTKQKMWLVQLAPPKGGTPKLKTRNTGEERTAVRNYTLAAASRQEAQSLVEQQERLICEQAVDSLLNEKDPKQMWDPDKREAFRAAQRPKHKPWEVDTVKAA